jgi:hypothetical protein
MRPSRGRPSALCRARRARERPRASYAAERLLIRIDPEDAEEWLAGDHMGFDHQQDVEGGVVRVLVEKDFACIDRRRGQEADDAYAFPSPSAVRWRIAVGLNDPGMGGPIGLVPDRGSSLWNDSRRDKLTTRWYLRIHDRA